MSKQNKNTIFSLIDSRVDSWIRQERTNSQSIVGELSKYIIKSNYLREPQVKAIEVYLWLKFIGQNQKLSQIIRQGLLYNENTARQYNNFYALGNNFTSHFLNQFFWDNNLSILAQKLANDPHGEEINWDNFLEELLHNYEYPNYLFSLPMGAGKTYLMACFIYLDLYFASIFKDDKRFAHNFIVLAPHASKTAIMPSLQTIKSFNPNWVLPEKEANKIKQIIQIEILDVLGSKRRDKLQGNNPNLEKVNRLSQTKDFGLVFITNAEKVVLESYDDKDKGLVKDLKHGQKTLFDGRKLLEFKKSNELREKLSQLSFLEIFLDEVHHAYGLSKQQEIKQKKLRQAVNIINQHKNIVSVLGFSGTPYAKHLVKAGFEDIRLNQIQDIVYNFPLNEGIGRFLKIPNVVKDDSRQDLFIKRALDDFFANYDLTYANGSKSKLVFYCPSIEKLNEFIFPEIVKWYQKNRPKQQEEIFRYYTNITKEQKQYQLPKDSLAIFNNLDKPYSDKRIVLLVAVGTEGWDCKSLAGVVLPRKSTTKNFVLQTTCRCLREVDNAANEKALIYLGDGNYEKLDEELRQTYQLHISDLKFASEEKIKILVRKPKLGKVEYNQIGKKYFVITKKAVNHKTKLRQFDFVKIKNKYEYDINIRQARIGRAGLVEEQASHYGNGSDKIYSFNDFVYDLALTSWGALSESDLVENYQTELKRIYQQIMDNMDWLNNHPVLQHKDIAKFIMAEIMAESVYRSELIEEKINLELLEWNSVNSYLPIRNFAGSLNKFMPDFNEQEARVYQRDTNFLQEDFLTGQNNIDPANISFNYIPYKMDSDFERNALKEMLILSEMKNLEVYYNGYKDDKLQNFYIKTPRGNYTPDFLIIKREGNKPNGKIDKILIIETKGKIYYDAEFKIKKSFVESDFLKYNPNFKYQCFVDEKGDNNFTCHLEELRNKINSL